MNIIIKILLFISLMPWHSIGCPCCVGTMDEDSPPFFSEECYQTTQQAPVTTHESKTQPTNKENSHE